MTKLFLKVVFCACLACPVAAQADQERDSPPAGAKREWTDHNTHDPGKVAGSALAATAAAPESTSVADELQKIVVLCATEPQSEKTRAQWNAYLKKHHKSGADVEALVERILAGADEFRARHDKAPQQDGERRLTRDMLMKESQAVLRNLN